MSETAIALHPCRFGAWTFPQGEGLRVEAPVAAAGRGEPSRSGKLNGTYPHRAKGMKTTGTIQVKPETSSSPPHVIHKRWDGSGARVDGAREPAREYFQNTLRQREILGYGWWPGGVCRTRALPGDREASTHQPAVQRIAMLLLGSCL